MFRSSLIAIGVLFIGLLTANFITTTGAGRPPHTTTAAYQGPGDIVSGATFWVSCQFAYTAAIAAAGTQKTCNLRRASDNHACDVIIATSGSWGNTANCGTGADNGQSASSFCTSTTCSVTEMYDQSGNANNFTQATAGDQPTIAFNKLGGNATIACVSASTQDLVSTTTIISIAQPYSYSSVAESTASGQSPVASGPAASSVPQIGFDIVAGDAYMYAGTVAEFTASDNAFHAIQSVFSGGSSVGYVDGTSNAVNPNNQSTGNNANGTFQICNDSSTTYMQGFIGEIGFWPSGFSAGNQSSMNSNQHSRWGF